MSVKDPYNARRQKRIPEVSLPEASERDESLRGLDVPNPEKVKVNKAKK